jgi:hypothetical protein
VVLIGLRSVVVVAGALVAVGLVVLMVVLVEPRPAEAQREPGAAKTQRTKDEVVGASISHPSGWSVEHEPYTYEKTYGFTLWRPEPGAVEDHGGKPALRVALAYDLKPSQIENEVQKTLDYYDGDLAVTRAVVSVGEKQHKGVAVGSIPGSTPSTEVYVSVNGRVYLINVYTDDPQPGNAGLGEGGKELLSRLHFEPPSRFVESLGLPGANSAEELYGSDSARREGLRTPVRSRLSASGDEKASSSQSPDMFRASSTGDTLIAEGCYRADPKYFIQTQLGPRANSLSGDGIQRGYTIVGRPNYWGEYTHGALGAGYGRCDKPYNTNDKFAVDYPFNKDDAVWSPFGCGTVTFAGRNLTHQDYGIFVSIRACNGRYVSLSGHLSGLVPGIRKGAKIDNRRDIIGYAGNSGGPNFPVGRVHLHQAFYRYPHSNADGSPYGGAGLQVTRLRYFRSDGGIYTFGSKVRPGIKAKDSIISY